jgi:hypothetical protein
LRTLDDVNSVSLNAQAGSVCVCYDTDMSGPDRCGFSECKKTLARFQQCLGRIAQRLYRCGFHRYVDVTGEVIIEGIAGNRVQAGCNLLSALGVPVVNRNAGGTRAVTGDDAPDISVSEQAEASHWP